MRYGALYGLEHHVDRLAEDHANAQTLAAAVRDSAALQLTPADVDTNIVIFQVDSAFGSAAEFVERLQQRGILMLSVAVDMIRAVTHLDVSDSGVCRAAEVIRKLSAS